METVYLFSVNPFTPPSEEVASGADVRARITLHEGNGSLINQPPIEVDDTIQVVGFGSTVEIATEDTAEAAVTLVSERSALGRQEAYMLLSIIGELRIGTSPRPVMAARPIIPTRILADAGWRGNLTGPGPRTCLAGPW